ncbi:MAG: methyltransferase domain-containing protein, partial [Candidatus Margulisbacteria bacterium]|nr:methyltransferase domain-containing protein [Candidatus Margulisiibacteriota bacterium]
LLVYIPQILKYLDQLGPRPQDILKIVRKLCLPKRPKILDLGCGKGAISNYLAKKIDCSITGIDSFGPFIDHAAKHAPNKKVKYFMKDICKELEKKNKYDLIIFVSVGFVYHGLARTITAIRKKLKPNGCYILENMYLKRNRKNRSKLYKTIDRAAQNRILASFKDRLIDYKIYEQKETVVQNKYFLARIKKGMKELSKYKPEIKPLLEQYYAQQEYESDRINKDYEIAVHTYQRRS